MITSGLVVQNHGKGTFPSSRSKGKISSRPYVDGYDKPIPTFSRPFDEKFTPTVNYRKVFGKGVTPDEKLYYLQHDAFQSIRKINALPLNRRTKAVKKLSKLEGTLLDQYLFLERLKHESGAPPGSMESIIGWVAGAAREPQVSVGRQSTEPGMEVDKRSILKSDAGSSASYETVQKRVLERSNPVTAELLDSGGDLAALAPQLSNFELEDVAQPPLNVLALSPDSSVPSVYHSAKEDAEMGSEQGYMTPGDSGITLAVIQNQLKKLKRVDKKPSRRNSVKSLYTDPVRDKNISLLERLFERRKAEVGSDDDDDNAMEDIRGSSEWE